MFFGNVLMLIVSLIFFIFLCSWHEIYVISSMHKSNSNNWDLLMLTRVVKRANFRRVLAV